MATPDRRLHRAFPPLVDRRGPSSLIQGTRSGVAAQLPGRARIPTCGSSAESITIAPLTRLRRWVPETSVTPRPVAQPTALGPTSTGSGQQQQTAAAEAEADGMTAHGTANPPQQPAVMRRESQLVSQSRGKGTRQKRDHRIDPTPPCSA